MTDEKLIEGLWEVFRDIPCSASQGLHDKLIELINTTCTRLEKFREIEWQYKELCKCLKNK